MASNQPLLPPTEAPTCKDRMKACGKKAGLYGALGCVAIFLVILGIQLCVYFVMTAGCGPKAIGEDYQYPGGGTSAGGGASYNLIPELSMVIQKKPSTWGWGFDCIPANDAGNAAAAQTGTFWRNWGILWYTYTYEDIANSKLTMYMRSRFWVPYMSYTIARCDGTGPTYYFTEGSNWISNKIRKLFRMNQAQTYKLYADSKEIGTVQEVASGITSLTLNDLKDKEKGSALLKERHFHGDSDVWYISNHESDEIPFWVTAAIALPTAYTEAETKMGKEVDTTTQAPTFLANADESSKDLTKTGKSEDTKTEDLSTATTKTEDQSSESIDTKTQSTAAIGTEVQSSTKTQPEIQTEIKAPAQGDDKLQHI